MIRGHWGRNVGLAVASLALACNPDAVDPSGDEAGSEAAPCTDAELEGNGWVYARTSYPQLDALWSDGERFLAYGHDGALLSFDGEALELREGFFELDNPELFARAPDDAWLYGSYELGYWDGETLTHTLTADEAEVVITAEGEAYFVGDSSDHAQSVLHWQGSSWVGVSVPVTVTGISSVWAEGEEMWVGGAFGRFAHRVDGEWTIEESGENFAAAMIHVEAGEVLAIGQGALARRSTAGEWSVVPGPSGDLERVPADAPGLTFTTQSGDAAPQLWRWQGGGSEGAEALLDLGTLGLRSSAAAPLVVAGRAEALQLLSTELAMGPTPQNQWIHGVQNADSSPLVQERLHFESTPWRAGSAYAIDATLHYEGPRVWRWDPAALVFVVDGLELDGADPATDRGRWFELFTLPTTGAEAPEIDDLIADGSASAWMLVEPDPSDPDAPLELRRWADGEAGLWQAWQPPVAELRALDLRAWGRTPWLVAEFEREGPNAAVLWRFEPSAGEGEGSWIPTLTVEDDMRPIESMAELNDGLVVATDRAEVWRWSADQGWTVLAEQDELYAPSSDSNLESVYVTSVGSTAKARDIVARVRYSIGFDSYETFTELHRYDPATGQWTPFEPPVSGGDTPFNDATGRAWLLGESQLSGWTLHRHLGEAPADHSWEPVEDVPIALSGLRSIRPTADGLLLHAQRYTATFRWQCSELPP
ncbi:hypothetical protein PPSIR1_37054 [Plesiocystis pacifica SIR-1]|uniref:Lipoprotein n=1 Tax=Plesiocystis pacifica SIR-1 TaxID=391625 RepID=A6G0H6_9BACT|nr:hypothetical protein [Plesiocystis pacifica]EDM80622.1 hypothetical protein PPSIR1_37054 [Plesiocystis pacifica SIR-1]